MGKKATSSNLTAINFDYPFRMYSKDRNGLCYQSVFNKSDLYDDEVNKWLINLYNN